MESKIATSIEQSQLLSDSGLSPDTADMYYHWDTIGNAVGMKLETRPLDYSLPNDSIPAWTTDRLIALLPPTIETSGTTYALTIRKFQSGIDGSPQFEVAYEDTRPSDYPVIFRIKTHESLMVSCVEMLGDILKEKNNETNGTSD